MSTCILVADGDEKAGQDLALLQVIEGLAYGRQAERVDITFDFLLDNRRNTPSRLIFVHRGRTVLQPSGENLLSSCGKENLGKNSSLAILRGIYKKRLWSSGGQRGFYERENCYLCKPAPIPVEHWVPGAIEIRPCEDFALAEEDVFLPFSAFEATLPAKRSWLRLHLVVAGATYEYLVKRQIHFWVDGPGRVLEQIAEKDIPQRGYLVPGAADFFNHRLKPHWISADAYDVVIYGKGIDEVDSEVISEPITGDVFEAPLDKAIQCYARHYVTRSPEFWIDCCYADDLAEIRNYRDKSRITSASPQGVSG